MGAAPPLAQAFGGLLALAIAVGIGRFVYTPILPLMAEELQWGQSEAGAVASANFAGYLIGALVAAGVWMHGAARRWLIGALILSAFTTFVMALQMNVWASAVLRFVGGAASAFVMVFASTVVLEGLAKAGRSSLVSVHFSGVGVGIAVSALLVGFLRSRDESWPVLWLAAGGLAALLVIAVAWLIPAADKPADESVSGLLVSGQRSFSGRFLGWVAAYGLFGFGYVITATFLAAIVRQAHGVSYTEGFIWCIVGVSAIPSVWCWDAISRCIGIGSAYAIACVVLAVGVVASVFGDPGVGLLLAAVFLGGTFMGITALGLVGAKALSAGSSRRVLALLTAAFGSGQIVGPLVAGALFDITGSFFVPSVLAAIALLLAAFFAFWAAPPGANSNG